MFSLPSRLRHRGAAGPSQAAPPSPLLPAAGSRPPRQHRGCSRSTGSRRVTNIHPAFRPRFSPRFGHKRSPEGFRRGAPKSGGGSATVQAAAGSSRTPAGVCGARSSGRRPGRWETGWRGGSRIRAMGTGAGQWEKEMDRGDGDRSRMVGSAPPASRPKHPRAGAQPWPPCSSPAARDQWDQADTVGLWDVAPHVPSIPQSPHLFAQGSQDRGVPQGSPRSGSQPLPSRHGGDLAELVWTYLGQFGPI